MDEKPLISVCIAHYQGIDMLDECLASLRAQKQFANFEIIVHDDASPDGSAAHIRSFHPDVSLIESTENVGFCVANNRMAAAARGRYLLLLNNDATLFPDALSTLLTAARRSTHPAIVTLPQYDAESGVLIDNGCRLDPFLNPISNLRLEESEIGTVHGACLWIDKVLWEELGGFPEWFGSVAEDLYLCCRARLAGYQVRGLGQSGYRHRVGQSFGGGKVRNGRLSTTFRRRACSERNKTFVMAMTYPAPFMHLVLPVHLVLLLAEGVLLSILAGNPMLLRGIYLPVFVALYRQRILLRDYRRVMMRGRRILATGFFSAFDPLPHKLRMLLRHGLPRVT